MLLRCGKSSVSLAWKRGVRGGDEAPVARMGGRREWAHACGQGLESRALWNDVATADCRNVGGVDIWLIGGVRVSAMGVGEVSADSC
jgi:hypothetical protein